MKILQTHIVPKIDNQIRLSDYACQIFLDIPSRKGVKKAIKRKEILVDGKAAETGRWICAGQKIEWVDLELSPPKTFELELEVVFEDEHLAAIRKPAGIKTNGNEFRTIENALLFNLKKSKEKDALRIPRPVHRLDASTSGLLLIAKTVSAQIHLSRQFEERTIQKKYMAIVMGKIKSEGEINFPIAGKLAKTFFKTKQISPSLKNEWLSLVDLFPKTGRTHQLRIHLSQLGHPILGDALYGKKGLVLKHKGLFLCAVKLEFIHPVSLLLKKTEIELPRKFYTTLAREEKRWKKYYSD